MNTCCKKLNNVAVAKGRLTVSISNAMLKIIFALLTLYNNNLLCIKALEAT